MQTARRPRPRRERWRSAGDVAVAEARQSTVTHSPYTSRPGSVLKVKQMMHRNLTRFAAFRDSLNVSASLVDPFRILQYNKTEHLILRSYCTKSQKPMTLPSSSRKSPRLVLNHQLALRSSPTMLRHAIPLVSPSRYTALLPKRVYRIPSHHPKRLSTSTLLLSSSFRSLSSFPPSPSPQPTPSLPPNPPRPSNDKKKLKEAAQEKLQAGLTTVRSSPNGRNDLMHLRPLTQPVSHTNNPAQRTLRSVQKQYHEARKYQDHP